MRLYLLLFVCGFGCGGAQASSSATETTTAAGTDPADALLAENRGPLRRQPEAVVETAAPAITVVAIEHTPIEGELPVLRISAPRDNQIIRRGNVMLRLQLSNWSLEAPQGRHVHVIVDNEPYIAVRDISAAIDLNRLVQENLGHELAAGSHLLRVFPSRGHHESVKSAGAFAQVMFHYQTQNRSEFRLPTNTAPQLTFSRPKGCYVAGTPVLLDFFVTNIVLGSAASVHYAIDGVTGTISTWQPHEIRGLVAGDHTVQLALFDASGPVAGAFNDTTRTFRVAASCDAPTSANAAPPDSHAHH